MKRRESQVFEACAALPSQSRKESNLPSVIYGTDVLFMDIQNVTTLVVAETGVEPDVSSL
jgi:hypothetical protein